MHSMNVIFGLNRIGVVHVTELGGCGGKTAASGQQLLKPYGIRHVCLPESVQRRTQSPFESVHELAQRRGRYRFLIYLTTYFLFFHTFSFVTKKNIHDGFQQSQRAG